MKIHKMFPCSRTFRISKNFWPSEISTPLPTYLKIWPNFTKFPKLAEISGRSEISTDQKFQKFRPRAIQIWSRIFHISFSRKSHPRQSSAIWAILEGHAEISASAAINDQKVDIFVGISNELRIASFWATELGKILVKVYYPNFQNIFQKISPATSGRIFRPIGQNMAGKSNFIAADLRGPHSSIQGHIWPWNFVKGTLTHLTLGWKVAYDL